MSAFSFKTLFGTPESWHAFEESSRGIYFKNSLSTSKK